MFIKSPQMFCFCEYLQLLPVRVNLMTGLLERRYILVQSEGSMPRFPDKVAISCQHHWNAGCTMHDATVIFRVLGLEALCEPRTNGHVVADM
jgi:hypothetical protein